MVVIKDCLREFNGQGKGMLEKRSPGREVGKEGLCLELVQIKSPRTKVYTFLPLS